MRRIAYLIPLALLTPGLLLADNGAHVVHARENKRPNVLLIVTDDQRAGLEAMPRVRRRFIQGGRKYPNFFATTPQCCPSRASIMTGKYTHNHGVNNNDASQNLDPRTTVQYYLQRSGYRTAIFGKFLNNWARKLSPPYFTKWGIFHKSPTSSGNPYFDAEYNLNGDVKAIPGYTTNVLGRLASRFIRRSDRRDSVPWMAYVAPTAPHAPFKAEPKYEDAWVGKWKPNPAVGEKDLSDKPEYVARRDVPDRSGVRRRRKQLRTLRSVDDMITRLFRTMKKNGERNTIAVFVSDNGMLWAEHELLTKNVPYQPSVNVPFLVRWPGHIEKGSVDRRLTANIDIAPTILDAAGIDATTAQFDGKSLLDRTWTRDRIHLEFFGPAVGDRIPPWAATRTKDYQYTEYYHDDDDVADFREYYDLKADPWELRNLYGDKDESNDPVDGEIMRARLQLDRACMHETCP